MLILLNKLIKHILICGVKLYICIFIYMNNLNIKYNPSYNKYMKSNKKKNIIIICAGDDSYHQKKKWFAKSRKYVLCVNYFW